MSAASPSAAALRCSLLAQAEGYLPAGTAASAPAFLLVEIPLPWPSDVSEHPQLRSVAAVAAAHQARIQALVPDPAAPAAPPGTIRVVVQRRTPGPFQAYAGEERLLPADRLAGEIESLLAAAPGPAEPRPVVPVVLVCGHGARDVCCGRDGVRVHRDLLAMAPLALPGTRVWRTSHTGGHRFAPTAVTFPDGRAWAWVDAATLAGIATRTLDAREAAARDRGCAAFADPFAQAADSAVLAAEGWSWLDRPRTIETAFLDESRRTVTLTAGPATAPGATAPARGVAEASRDAGAASAVTYRAEVRVRRVVPVPDCGRPLDQARKSSQELEVESLTRL